MSDERTPVNMQATAEDLAIFDLVERHYGISRAAAIRMAIRELARRAGLIPSAVAAEPKTGTEG